MQAIAKKRAWERGCVSSGVLEKMEKTGERRSAGASLYICPPGFGLPAL